MPHDNQTIEALRMIFVELSVPHRSALGVAGKLCDVAARVDRLECFLDSNEKLHVLLNGTEVFQCELEGGKTNFRNLLAVFSAFAGQFTDKTKTAVLSPYGLDCVINPPKDAAYGAAGVHLKTVNTASEQRFCLSKI